MARLRSKTSGEMRTIFLGLERTAFVRGVERFPIEAAIVLIWASILLSLISKFDVVALSDVSGAVGGKIAFSPQGQQSQLKSPVIMSFRSDGRLLQLGLNL